MKSIKHTILLGLLVTAITGSLSVSGQQYIGNTQFMWNQSAVNPAYAGAREAMSATLFYRQQWAGMQGAPQTQNAAIHSPFMHDKIGLGLNVMHDQLGITEQMTVSFQGAYKLHLDQGTLAFGLSGEWAHMQVRWTDSNAAEQNDQSIPQADLSENGTNFGFGVHFQNKRLYAGLAVPRLLERDLAFGDGEQQSQGVFQQRRHLYFMGGYVIPLSAQTVLKPAMMIRSVPGAPVQVDLSASVFLNKTIWVGAGYRLGESLDFLVEYAITKQLRVGYAFDLSTTKLQDHGGSHEFFLGLDLQAKKEGFNHPRFF